MTAESADIKSALAGLTIEDVVVGDPLLNNRGVECETAEEAITTDSEEYLSEPLRFRRYSYSDTTTMSNETLRANSLDGSEAFYACNGNVSRHHGGFQIPIVGYEIMEERARFTVFKLRIENRVVGNCWYVFRRYTDFVRLCNRLRHSHPGVTQYLPRKRWLGNNFDPLFLDDRLNGLQVLINAILSEPDLAASREIQDFFCLSEPPLYSETSEESRAIFESLEETIYHLKQQVLDKERVIDNLHDVLREKATENENLKKLIKKPPVCENCLGSSPLKHDVPDA